MATNTLLIEGSFDELADELARRFPRSAKKEQSEEELTEEQTKQVQDERVEVLKKMVLAAPVLNAAPEKGIYPFSQPFSPFSGSSSVDMFLPKICAFLAKPMPSSPLHGPSIALSILATVFNTLDADDSSRYHVFLAVMAVIRSTSSALAFEALKSQLANQLPGWIESWDLDEDETQKLHMSISDAARAAGDAELSYHHLIQALHAIQPSEAASKEAREMAVRCLTTALSLPFVFDFTPLTSSDAVQNVRSTDASLFELLEIFSTDNLDAYEDFIKTTPVSSIPALASVKTIAPTNTTSTASSEPPSVDSILQTKMRLLTLASLAAKAPSRSLPYDDIATALRIDRADVEKWVIDTIRAGLVEGKLSQLKGEFLVHRATYRVFGERQWREVQGRLMVWKQSLENVLDVIRSEKEKFAKEAASAASAPAQTSGEGDRFSFGGRGGGERRRGGHQSHQHQARDMELVAGGD
ncbi:PCI domain-containing protein [Microsporum canis CBS 113480]|uniref:Eukaryotic translation initiation factor 3 subunit M n=1 Tax=Arthroderma otae (strain ATCC MYA-4605 / CBS 113480) TaxID=554155 RepID=C5FYC8_ARTOC|nr:PCI domain-containing protein [Microsporum canis CBS 113480]EEQ34526.1 PCI domain-containing protein [Microsporum canis CBS 113480]